MLQAIKVKERVIILNQIVHIEDSWRGLEVTFTNGDSLIFHDTKALDFLRQFDALTCIVETDAESDVIRYLEKTNYVELIPVDVVDCLSDDALERLKLNLFTIKKFASKPTSVHFDEVMRRVTKQMDMRGLPKTDAVAEAVAAPETGSLRDAIPHLYTMGLEKLDDVLNKIIDSNAPVSAREEARILKQAVKKELAQRFDYLKD